MNGEAADAIKLFRQNKFPEFERLDWLITKIISLSANQNAQILEICFDEIILCHRRPLRSFTDH